MELVEIPLVKVTVSNGRRKATAARVEALAKSIFETGLQHPIGVTSDYRLIYGLGRLEAYRKLGRDKIPALVHEVDDVHAGLMEIDENLCREDLTAIQEAQALKRRKELWESLYPETKAHVAGGKAGGRGRTPIASDNVSFANDTAAKTGKSRRSVERSVEVAEKLPEEVQNILATSCVADNRAQLKLVADLEAPEQRKVAKLIAEKKAPTVQKALEILHPEEEEPDEGEDLSAKYAKELRKVLKPWVKKVNMPQLAGELLIAYGKELKA